VRLGEPVEHGQPLLNVFARADMRAAVESRLRQAFTIGPQSIGAPPLVIERVEAEGSLAPR
ncbi:MAG TPA: hypothetical protein VMF30_11985, partial [Pirellulales bacterium]|nr:hypothetical protein [Pirellulales bacterium]